MPELLWKWMTGTLGVHFGVVLGCLLVWGLGWVKERYAPTVGDLIVIKRVTTPQLIAMIVSIATFVTHGCILLLLEGASK